MNPIKRAAAIGTTIAALGLLPATANADTGRSADAFVDSVGVNTHVIFDDTAYGDFAGVRAALKELGVRHIRDGICGTCGWQMDRYRTLAGDGIRLDALVGKPTDSPTVLSQNLAAVKSLGSFVTAVEGANEWDSMTGLAPDWAAQNRAFQQWLWNSVNHDPQLKRLGVVGPSLVFSWLTPSSWDVLGNIASIADYGNSHGYAGGRAPETAIDGELARAQTTTPGKRVMFTESGFHNAIQQVNWDHPGVPESVGATYTARMFLENFRRGVARTYSYELLDERPGLAAVDREQSFGLLRSDLSRKPAFITLRNLLATLSDPGATVPGRDVPLTVSTNATVVRRLVLVKRSGEVNVVLWRAVSQWNTATRTVQTYQPASVRIQPGRALVGARIVDPSVSTAEAPVPVNANGVDIKVGASPVVLKLTLG
jgi:hypothetical protein